MRASNATKSTQKSNILLRGLFLLWVSFIAFALPEVIAGSGAGWLLAKTKWGTFRRWGLLLILGIVCGHNLPDPGLYLFTWVPALVLSVIGYWLLNKAGVTEIAPEAKTLASLPTLGWLGVSVVILILVLIYGLSYGLITPENLPPKEVQFITLGLYGALILILGSGSQKYVK